MIWIMGGRSSGGMDRSLEIVENAPGSGEACMTPGEKDRGQIRYERRLPIRFGTSTQMHGGTVVDISEGGLRLRSLESFPIGTFVDVFVQFPRHAIHLQARIVWTGGSLTGLTFAAPTPLLIDGYARWREAIAEAARGSTGSEPEPQSAPLEDSTAASTDASATPPAAAPPPPPDPTEPVQRRFETSRGQGYESLIEKEDNDWVLTIHQVPRQPGVERPEKRARFRDYAAADRALREFIRDH
jgi:hypothetical protein